MEIHTNLTAYDFQQAARTAGAWLYRCDEKGSRTRDRKFDVIISGSSNRRMNFGNDEMAATWDQWGIFLNHIFQADPLAHSYAYAGLQHFRMLTHRRFDNLTLATACPDHHWIFAGTPREQECSKCSAVRTWVPDRPIVVKGAILHNIDDIERFLVSA